ncbi:hypothetical protein EUX98_g9662 [Antrodiella citrinella]|uniref:Uncharacterized protein n=1 Tax=Antrodiella citrinella TaxID=2447956 RepID=A0A4S4LPZ4_9APHY|nr:hypothetical protein EUX98_g9662 [Antrodiella citrinella]
MPSHIAAPIFAAALTQVVQWLDFKTFGRAAWYDRAVLLLRDASDTAPSFDDLKLAGVRMEVRAALASRVLTAHPPDALFEELAMPVTPVGATIFASELDELDTIAGPEHAAQATAVEEKWAAADALWREKAAPSTVPKNTARSNARPRPTTKTAIPATPPPPKVPTKRKGGPTSYDEEDSPPPPARSGKTPAPKKTAKGTADRPERAVRRRRPVWSTKTDDEFDDKDTDEDAKDVVRTKRAVDRVVKKPQVTKSDKDAYPDEDPSATPSDWFVYRELKKCLKCAASRAKGGLSAECTRRRTQTDPRRYFRVGSCRGPGPSVACFFVPHSDAARPAFRVDSISFVEDFPSCLASIRRRAALTRVHPDSQPASRALADVVEQSLASAQVQMTTGLLLARSLLRDRAPGFRGADADPAELEDPLDEDLPADFTEEPHHPTAFRLERTPLIVPRGCTSVSPIVSVPPPFVVPAEPSVRADSRHSPVVSSDTASPGIALSPKPTSEAVDEDLEGSEGDTNALEGVDDLDDTGSGEGEGDDDA